jgi:hypothetical protein
VVVDFLRLSGTILLHTQLWAARARNVSIPGSLLYSDSVRCFGDWSTDRGNCGTANRCHDSLDHMRSCVCDSVSGLDRYPQCCCIFSLCRSLWYVLLASCSLFYGGKPTPNLLLPPQSSRPERTNDRNTIQVDSAVHSFLCLQPFSPRYALTQRCSGPVWGWRKQSVLSPR